MPVGPSAGAPERFEIRAKLGAGGMGVVYRALDRRRGTEVALKVLSNVTGRDIYRFKREFRALADLAHPNLVSLYELHTAGDDWFLTMELVVGATFIQWVRPDASPAPGEFPQHTPTPTPAPAEVTMPTAAVAPRVPLLPRFRAIEAPLDVARLEDALYQLADTVHALHQAGKLHRDLKPSNVLVDAGGRVQVLDFGLITDMAEGAIDRTHEPGAGAIGTPAYMSPEQAAGQPLTHASDWYSVGVMLYEALTGRRPIDLQSGEHPPTTATPPPPPERYNPRAPPHLSRLCLALLALDPAERPDGAAVLAALGREPSTASRELAASLQSSPFVGRERELEVLRRAQLRAREGRGVAVFVRGVSGMGKSSLVRQFLDEVRAETPGAVILRGRCYERESVPFKTLDTVVDALTAHLLGLPPEALEELLPRDAWALARLFPATRRVPAIAEPAVRPMQPPDPIELRRRAFGALRELCANLARRAPLVIALDDLQWGDADSGNFLAELLVHPEAPPLCLVLAHRLEDEAGSPLLAALTRARTAIATGELVAPMAFEEITLEPLSGAEARALVRLVGGSRDPAHAREVVKDAGGSPLFLSEMMRASKTARSLDDAVRARLSRLPAEARRLAEISAIAGHPLRQGVAARAAGLRDEGKHLAVLRVERILRVRRAGDAEPQIEPYHDRIRTAIASSLPQAELRAAHGALAAALEEAGDADREALVTHFRAAGEDERAARHAALAAEAAEERLAFHRAAELYELALAHSTDDDATRQRLRIRMGHALRSSGQIARAGDVFGAAADASTSEAERLDLRRLQMEQLVTSGQLERGVALAGEMLEGMGVRVPSSRGGALLAMLGQRVMLKLRGLKFEERAESTIDATALQHLDVLASLSNGFTMISPIFGRALQTRLLREALAVGEPNRVALALSLEIGYLGTLGTRGYEQAHELGRRTLELTDRLAEKRLVGNTRGAIALASYLAGKWREGYELGGVAEQTLRDQGAFQRWQLDLVEFFRSTCAWYLGDMRELVRMTSVYLRDADERGDAYAQRGLRGWRTNVAWLVIDRPDEARAQLASVAVPLAAGQAAQLGHYYELVSRAMIDLYEGKAEDAHACVEAMWTPLERAMLMRIQSVIIEAGYLRARAALAVAAGAGDAARRAGLVKLARRAAKRVRAEDTPWSSAYAAAIRAGIARIEGDAEDEVSALREALGHFQAADMALFGAAVERRLGQRLAGDEGRAFAASAEARFREQGVADPLALSRVMLGVAD